MAILYHDQPSDSKLGEVLKSRADRVFSVEHLLSALFLVALIMSACQTAPPVSPTPLSPSTPLSPQPPVQSSAGNTTTPRLAVQPSTPLPPPPTPRPRPTPISLTGFNWTSVAYREYWPTDLSGDLSVGLGRTGINRSEGGVFLVDVKDGEKRRITNGGHQVTEVVIFGDYIAWADRSRQIEIPGSSAINRVGRLTVDIFLMDLNTGEQRRITDVPARRRSLSIDGNMLVWQDDRNEIGEHRTHFNIYAYDLEADEEIAVEVAPGAQEYPSISGDRVVWIDNGGDSAGVMLYDFAEDETKVIDASTEPELPPDIHGDYIVWRGHDVNGDHALYLHDLTDGQQEVIASPRMGSTDSPVVSDRYVVWTVGWPCDVVANIMPDDMGVYVYGIDDGEVLRVSNYVEPNVLIDGAILLVHEGCHLPGRVYAVSLSDAAPTHASELTSPSPGTQPSIEAVYRYVPTMVGGAPLGPLFDHVPADRPVIARFALALAAAVPIAPAENLLANDRGRDLRVRYHGGANLTVRQVSRCEPWSNADAKESAGHRCRGTWVRADGTWWVEGVGMVASPELSRWWEEMSEFMVPIGSVGIPETVKAGEPFKVTLMSWDDVIDGDSVSLSLEPSDGPEIGLGCVSGFSSLSGAGDGA